VKESGIDRSGAKCGLEGFLDVEYLCMGGVDCLSMGLRDA
jgi:hypothetical protein